MYEIKYDSINNRIYLKLSGFIQLKEATEYRDDYTKYAIQAKPGFTYLLDARGLKTLPQESMEKIQEIRSEAVDKGCKKGAMIVDSMVLKMQSNRTGKLVDGFIEEYFDDVDKAENFLNE